MIRKSITLIAVFILVAAGSSAYPEKPLKGVSILLDPGHGGTDPGAIGPTGLKESDTNLRVARYLKALLEADGAEVSLTRNGDVYLSLNQRIEIAKKLNPDLFVSIHHNSSLQPRKANRVEIYYNALDQGLSQLAGKKMLSELESYGFGEESLIVPGGFFVLRNNPSPAVLTEGSYISIPAIERRLKTGKALTDQANALRLAIREAFSNGPLRIKMFVSEPPVKVDTEYFNFIFSANKPISQIRARISQTGKVGFGFEELPAIGNTYRLYNTKPLTSGKYDLQFTFYAKDGAIAPRINLPVEVALPLANCTLESVAPYIPYGFKGKFPLVLTLRDYAGRLNTRSVKVALFYKENSELIAITNPDGETTIMIDLDGNETEPVEVRAVFDSEIIAKTVIPVREPLKHFVLGRVIDSNGNGIKGARVSNGITLYHSKDKGYFFLEYPLIFRNLQVKINSALGFEEILAWIKTKGEPVVLKDFVLKPIAADLMGKKIGIIAPQAFDGFLRKLVRELMFAGAIVKRLALPENMKNPEYQAVLEVNLEKDFDLVLSFKKNESSKLIARHYHKGGKGKIFADKVATNLVAINPENKLFVEAGADYEISHTGATCVVISIPRHISVEFENDLLDSLIKTFKSGL
ncbi:MAG: hypothetical protein Kow0029_13140 [Candidatus Rifleibacteriota bacterium]